MFAPTSLLEDDCHSSRSASGFLLAVLAPASGDVRFGRRSRRFSSDRRGALQPSSRRASGGARRSVHHLLLGPAVRARGKSLAARGRGCSALWCGASGTGDRVTDLVALGLPFVASVGGARAGP